MALVAMVLADLIRTVAKEGHHPMVARVVLPLMAGRAADPEVLAAGTMPSALKWMQ